MGEQHTLGVGGQGMGASCAPSPSDGAGQGTTALASEVLGRAGNDFLGDEANWSVCYRTGPLAAADYDEAIRDLRNAKRALVKGDSMGCRVCEDSGHSAAHCHHNPLLLARKWARATGVWQCWHCGYVATNDAEGREHFGYCEDDEPACFEAKASVPSPAPTPQPHKMPSEDGK